MSRGDRLMIEAVFDADRDVLPPAEPDLLRMCRPKEQVDAAILPHDFGGLAAAANGRVYIYECAQVRSARRLDRS
jgi:hypothetical protein